eukprot:c10838_g1_i1.p1 GENE.c10838_g1_i1~~c10838_g1_i1.p1  ORF type:complete len:560 (-),score=136.42 c10838_g1_i1:187-1866(-)
MSVIVRDPITNKAVIYCKGADSAILDRLVQTDPARANISQHLAEFAVAGLRTLCLAYAELKPAEYEAWRKVWTAAEVAVSGRDEKLSKAAESIETELNLVGVSAIEDKLQEGVPETISTLLRANINIWMLTGDKEETAINIAYSCRLLDSSPITYLTSSKVANSKEAEKVLLDVVIRNANDPSTKEQIIIDGKVLEWCLSDHPQLLLSIAPISRAVVVCRATPLQKAETVRIVKDGLNKITLAIGDGANDVPMIQAAHIGIGIAGEEGCQAVRSSDYSIGQFRFLQWLLLVQGRWYYDRIAILFLFSFYKNFAFTLCHLWLGLRSSMSGQTYFNDMTISVFNMFYTSLPILLIGVFDRDLSPQTILDHPELYIAGQQNKTFKLRRFWGWIVWGSIQSIPIFTIPMYIFEMNLFGDGQVGGLWASSTTSTLIVVLVANVKIILEANLFNWFHFHALFFGFWSFICVTYAYEVYLSLYFPNDPLVGVFSKLCSDPVFWLTVVLVTTLTVLPDFIFKAVRHLYFPTPALELRRLERMPRRTSVMPSLAKDTYQHAATRSTAL